MNELGKGSASYHNSSHQECCEELPIAADAEVSAKWVSVPETLNLSCHTGSDIASQHSLSDTDRGKEINSLNCASVAESTASKVSSLIDDDSVDLESKERALLELRALLGRAQRRRQEVVRPLLEANSTSFEEFGRGVWCGRKSRAVLESSEDKACSSKPRKQNRSSIRKMSCEPNEPDSGAPERNEKEDEGDGSGAPRVVVLKHPLNEILGKAQLKDDAKYEASESGAGVGKRNHTTASLDRPIAVSPEKETQRPCRKSRKSKVAGQGILSLTESKKEEPQDSGGAVRRALEAHNGTGSGGGNFTEKVMQLLSSDSCEELTAALFLLIVDGREETEE